MRYPVIITAALSLAACVADVDNVDSQPSDKNDAVVESDKQMNERAKQASKLIETALAGTQGYDITESLTTEVGQRLAGTEAEARARDWAVQKFKDIGLENVRVEPFTIPGWERGDESAYIISPYPQKLEITTLGYSFPIRVGCAMLQISPKYRLPLCPVPTLIRWSGFSSAAKRSLCS